MIKECLLLQKLQEGCMHGCVCGWTAEKEEFAHVCVSFIMTPWQNFTVNVCVYVCVSISLFGKVRVESQSMPEFGEWTSFLSYPST